jgi:GTP pyrophosphokinase
MSRPFAGELRATFGEPLADVALRALDFAAGRLRGRARRGLRARPRGRAPAPRPGGGAETVAAALISQSIGERDLDLEAVQAAFGAELAGAAALDRARRPHRRADRLRGGPEQLRKMLLAIAEDVRVVLIKIAERVVYLRSLTKADEAVKRAAGRESLDLFGPLANRLGVSDMKWELEDYSFRFTEPDLYHRIAKLLDEKRHDRPRPTSSG